MTRRSRFHSRFWTPFTPSGLLFRALTPDDYVRTFMHPEHGPQTLEQTLASYAWHGAHHTAHILSLRRRRSR